MATKEKKLKENKIKNKQISYLSYQGCKEVILVFKTTELGQ